MKTLVIHPADQTTAMLSEIYKDSPYTIVTNNHISEEELISLIKSHDRIIMLGHGLGLGLLRNPINDIYMDPVNHLSYKNQSLFIIDDHHASILKDKILVAMWCYANEYFIRNNLSGFYSGMIISEKSESEFVLGHCPLTPEELYNNIEELSRIVKEAIKLPSIEMVPYVQANYTGDDEITTFNRKNFFST